MTSCLPLALMLGLCGPVRDDDPRARAIAPFVGDEVAVVAHLDLKLDVEALARRLLGGHVDEEDVGEWSRAGGQWVAALREAGAKDIFVLVSLADFPGPPVAVVPLVEGANAEAIGRVLCGGGKEKPPYAWPTCATIHNAVFAGTPAALERARRPLAAPRPELLAAFLASGDAAAQLLFLPGRDARRVFEELVPTLPRELGGGPSTTLTRGLTWAAVSLEAGPNPRARVDLQAKDLASAQAMIQVGKDALKLIGQEAQKGRFAGAGLAAELDRIKPEVVDDRVVVRLDLAPASAVVVIPALVAQEESHRAGCLRNMLTLGLAFHNYLGTHNTFPPASSRDKAGRPLLSWRVLVLPFLEEKALYDQFHLDEPWDSPHNRTLIARMPAVFACPDEARKLRKLGKTTYLVPHGKAAMFAEGEGIKINDVTDGTSNTILLVDAADDRAVIWTKPDDWEVDPEPTKAGLFGHHAGGTNFTFADGSVRFLKESIGLATLRLLTTRNGGEVAGPDDF